MPIDVSFPGLVGHFNAVATQLCVQHVVEADTAALYMVDFGEGVDHMSDLFPCQHGKTRFLMMFFYDLNFPSELGVHSLHEALHHLGVEDLDVRSRTVKKKTIPYHPILSSKRPSRPPKSIP